MNVSMPFWCRKYTFTALAGCGVFPALIYAAYKDFVEVT